MGRPCRALLVVILLLLGAVLWPLPSPDAAPARKVPRNSTLSNYPTLLRVLSLRAIWDPVCEGIISIPSDFPAWPMCDKEGGGKAHLTTQAEMPTWAPTPLTLEALLSPSLP